MDPTTEAIEALGERNMSVMRALNRQYYKQFQNQADSGRSEGGILSGGGVGSQSSSIFASQQASEDDSARGVWLWVFLCLLPLFATHAWVMWWGYL